MNSTAVTLQQHGFPVEPVQPARQVSLIVDRLSDDNLRQSSHKAPIVIHTPKRSIETWRRNLEDVRVIDHVLYVENRAQLVAHSLAVLDADARIRSARHGPRLVGRGPIEIDPQDPPARFAPVLYVEDFQVIGPRDSLSDGSYPLEGIHSLDRGAPPPASQPGPQKQKSGHKPTSVDRTSVALSLYHTGSSHNNVRLRARPGQVSTRRRLAWPDALFDLHRIRPRNQVVFAGADNRRVRERARRETLPIAFGEVHTGVDVRRLALQPPSQDQLVVRCRPVNQHPYVTTNAYPLGTLDDPLLQSHQPVPAPPFFTAEHVIWKGECRGAFFMRIAEDPEVVESSITDEGVQLVEVTFGLARKADNKGCPQRDIRYFRANPGQKALIGAARAGTLHRFQYSIRGVLQR